MARKREHCRDCKRHTDECGQLSRRGKCADCGTRAVVAAAEQVEARSGPYYERWRAGMVDAGSRVAPPA